MGREIAEALQTAVKLPASSSADFRAHGSVVEHYLERGVVPSTLMIDRQPVYPSYDLLLSACRRFTLLGLALDGSNRTTPRQDLYKNLRPLDPTSRGVDNEGYRRLKSASEW